MIGSKPQANVVINEMTTVASVSTNAQFLDGWALKGHALGLRIAAGNVPSFVDLETGGWGGAIRGPAEQRPDAHQANFATLADVLSGCITRVKAWHACDSLFDAAKWPGGNSPVDTLGALESIAQNPWHQPEKVFSPLGRSTKYRRALTC